MGGWVVAVDTGRVAVGLTFNAGECSGGGRDWWRTRIVTDGDGRGWARMGAGGGRGWTWTLVLVIIALSGKTKNKQKNLLDEWGQRVVVRRARWW